MAHSRWAASCRFLGTQLYKLKKQGIDCFLAYRGNAYLPLSSAQLDWKLLESQDQLEFFGHPKAQCRVETVECFLVL